MMTPYICNQILDGPSEGLSLSAICRDIGMPSCSTVQRNLNGSAPEQVAFRAAYDRALEVRERILLDQILATIDDARGDPVERRNEDGESYVIHDPNKVRRARLVSTVWRRELERLMRRREAARQGEPPPVPFVFKTVNFMDLPPEVRARYGRVPGGSDDED